MKGRLIFLGLCLFVGCQQSTSKSKHTPTVSKLDSPTNINLISELSELALFYDSDLSYDSVKRVIVLQKNELQSSHASLDSLSVVFQHSLLRRIIPYWEGTDWSFEGHTSVPKVGEIACGYFVSTTLQDVGVNINRYKLAQQNPENEAKSLALESGVIEIEAGSVHGNIEEIKNKLPEGIHFIGLGENHVGYVLKDKGQLYLIHSNYMGPHGVEIETIEESQVFPFHKKFFLAEISTNKYLLKKWVTGEKIEVITE